MLIVNNIFSNDFSHVMWLKLFEKKRAIIGEPNICLAISTSLFPLKSFPILDINIILLNFFLLIISNVSSTLVSKYEFNFR